MDGYVGEEVEELFGTNSSDMKALFYVPGHVVFLETPEGKK